MSNPALAPATLVARTRPIDLDRTPLEIAPPDAFAWLHGRDGIVGWGEAARVDLHGARTFAEASRWWSDLTAHAVVRDEVEVPGSGLLAFGSFAFDPTRSASRLVVPEVVLGRRGDLTWATSIRTTGLPAAVELAEPARVREPRGLRFAAGTLDAQAWQGVVRSAVERIERGELDKVVLARDAVAELDEPLDVRHPLRELAAAYPSCWTFHIDGFFGSTPEMLVRRERGLVASRVLAGTIRRTGDDEHDLALAGSLARSSKDREEHGYAVRSVVEALAPHCASMNVPESPYVLHLPNVMHLATDVTGVARDAASVLTLAAALHPSAAVGGTPREAAVRLIAESEGLDRGPYAGPVGWIDADGDGEWGIGLRSAICEDGGRRVRLFAGCGIVADSDPADELAESEAKLIPVRDALS